MSPTGQEQDKHSQTSLTLRTISFSHYNEKARWALDYYKVPYIEYRSLPMCHMISMFKYRAKTRPCSASSAYATPHLTVEPTKGSGKDDKDKETIALNDSSKIIEFLSDQYAAPANSNGKDGRAPNLYSNDEASKTKIQALEERFNTMIGPHVRRVVYYELLFHAPKSVARSMGQHDNAGQLQSWIWSFFLPLFTWMLCKAMHITEKSASRSKDILKREFEHISRVLESGPPGPAYLVGNQFSAADLALASLGGLVVGVSEEDGYGAWVPKMDVLRPEGKKFMEELRATTAGQHIVECYKLHRGSKAPGSGYGFNFFGLW
ncbi:hypothetical protein BGZ96_011191 [Linnemannia gamsii]|uniref:Glutathione S-transferase n=1 Tax=Linnemannia gamsii TaxID=64522 RepID=A0ABQ7JTJ8_9FUNG|nr:hypothetical protein BGZ96_011191 [Linnemannia gamsii]